MEESQPSSLNSLLARWGSAVEGTSHPQPPEHDGPDVHLTGLVEHTDDVEPGKCFVARVRTGTDGHPYIGQAVDNGASLILGQRPLEDLDVDLRGVPYLKTDDSAITEAWLSAAWFNFPSRHLVMIGVTGTDGKTTTVNLIHQILLSSGIKAGMLSTIKAAIGDTTEPLALHVTTPEAPVVQAYLRRMVDAGLTHCVMEITSHGLAQHRADAIDFDLALVTNITHEHLDYHGGYEEYFAAKARLFSFLAQEPLQIATVNKFKNELAKTAILNRDDDSYERLVTLSPSKHLTYAVNHPANITALDIKYSTETTHFYLSINKIEPAGPGAPSITDQSWVSRHPVTASIVGEFNVSNMLAAASAAYALGIGSEAIGRGLESIAALSGRMERIDLGQPFLVVVDFAHTPNALEKAIAAARGMTDGRIITVFGSAGKRDVAKRRLMAEISARDADLTVLTAEDPRTESLNEILDMMADGCHHQRGVEGTTFWRIPDRGQAIYFALTLAQPKDLLLICGKGHEQSMCFGTIEYPWDDPEATRTALTAFLTQRAMPDLGLPTYHKPHP